MKRISICREEGAFPAMLFYKNFAVSGEGDAVILYQVSKRKDGLYDTNYADFLAEDIKYESLVSLLTLLLISYFTQPYGMHLLIIVSLLH
ncbi:hypothetical protein AB7C35_16585 [Bacillus subtilis]|uniref:hypothetical protein n=1 Tax=Bacillus subtilis TaxID=1423 RepID=UPI0035158947